MSTDIEREDIGKNLGVIIPMCCNGNKDAEEYLRMVCFSVRIMDDAIDKDREIKEEDLYESYFYLFSGLASNLFYLQNIQALASVQTVAFNAWMDATEWEKGNNEQRRYASVIRDYINEICPLVAHLTGGYKLMREVSLVIRESFMKEAL
jgi:hypothetical protein